MIWAPFQSFVGRGLTQCGTMLCPVVGERSTGPALTSKISYLFMDGVRERGSAWQTNVWTKISGSWTVDSSLMNIGFSVYHRSS